LEHGLDLRYACGFLLVFLVFIFLGRSERLAPIVVDIVMLRLKAAAAKMREAR
jgi:hypothetical protein